MSEPNELRITELQAKIAREVPELVARHQEWTYWDFKREWHHEKADLLHDIICLANNLDWHIAYLVIGIDEESDYKASDVSQDANRRSTEDLTNWLGNVQWAGSRRPQVIVVPLRYENATIDVVTIIPSREDIPYYLEKSSGKLRANAIYTRRNSNNTPADKSATREEVERLWSHRFGLDQAPIDRLPTLLHDRENWVQESQIYDTQKSYYKFTPEFTIEEAQEEDRDGYEYYMLNQCNSSPDFERIIVRYYGTQVYDDLVVVLDGGRYSSPIPEVGFIHWWGSRGIDPDVYYCYLNEDSLEWKLNLFLFDENSGEAEIARIRFLEMILVFPGEDFRQGFEIYVQENRSEFEDRLSNTKEPYIPRLPNGYNPEFFKKQIKQTRALKEMLTEYPGWASGHGRVETTTDW